jgi:dolichol-phosphate mannosyltransferase
MNFITKKWNMHSERISRFIKFGIVGASGIVVNNGILWLLTRQGLGDITASIIATETAIITNFIGNSLWTWGHHTEGGWGKRFILFQGISIFAGVLTVALFWCFKNLIGMPLLVANTAAIGVTFIINYLLNSRFTWRKTA